MSRVSWSCSRYWATQDNLLELPREITKSNRVWIQFSMYNEPGVGELQARE